MSDKASEVSETLSGEIGRRLAHERQFREVLKLVEDGKKTGTFAAGKFGNTDLAFSKQLWASSHLPLDC